MKTRHLGIPRIYMGKKLLSFAVLLTVCAAVAFSQAQRRPVLGILPFTGGTGGDGEAIATLISMESEILRNFTVVPRTAALNAIFEEHRFQLEGLTDSDTIAGIGRMLNADYVLSGTIRQLGDRNLVIATIINVETFEQVGGYHRTYRTIEEVRDFLPSMSRSMVSTALRQGAARLPSLAMLPFTLAPGVDAQDAETLSEILAIEILNTGDYVVLPRTSSIQSALAEMDFQMLGHTDDAGMAALGRAINADMVLSAGVHRLGALNMFTAQVLRVMDGSMFAGASRDYQVITDGIDLMAELAILLTDSDRARADRRIAELRRGRLATEPVRTQPAPSAAPAQVAAPVRAAGDVSVPGNTLAAQFTWLRNNAESNTRYVIELAGNHNLVPQALPTGRTNVTITLRGSGGRRNVNLSSNGSLFTIDSGVTLVLDSNVTLVGRSRGGNGNTNNNNHLVRVNRGGTLVMNTGARITGNNNTLGSPWPWPSHGSGVRVNDGGVFIMNGGEITGNYTFGTAAAGVLIDGGGRFNMYGGRISGNTNSTSYAGAVTGAGVVVVGGSTFNMRGGSISGNRSGRDGGGVYVQNGGIFRVSDGIIHGNNASGDLRNRAARRSAALSNSGTAQRGTFNAAGNFSLLGNLSTNNNTVHVVNGVLQ